MRRHALNDGWEYRPKVNLFAELSGTPAAEWEGVTLPHDAMIGTERSADHGPANAYFPGGTWEYRRTLDRPDGDDRSVVLDLEGVYRDAVVIVNGQTVARRPYGYSRFTVAIDQLLSPGANELRVEATAGSDSRWYSGAGLHRDVWLLEAGRLHLAPEGLVVRTPEIGDDAATVEVVVDVVNQTPGTRTTSVRVEVLDADGEVVAAAEAPATLFPSRRTTVRRRLHVADPTRWGPDHPYLHTCRVTLIEGGEVLDDDSSTFGFRTLSLDPRQGLRVNGERVLLRGACVHHDNGPLGAATISAADGRRVRLLKDAGFNAIRSAHNPMSRAMLDACDRHGVLVMDEAFDMWTQAKSDDDYAHRFPKWWEADVEAMVRNARNHPSVILYSVGNEIPDGSTPVGLDIGRALADKVRELDGTRYVTQAVTGILVGGPEMFADLNQDASPEGEDGEAGVNTVAMTMGEIMQQVVKSSVVDDKTVEAFAHLDVAGYNYMESRYEQDAERHPQRVIVGSETHPPAIAAGWSKVTAVPNVIGDFTWTGWDYLGEVGVGRAHHGVPDPEGPPLAFHAEYPWRTAWCGDIDITGHRRPLSHYREIVYGLRRDPYLAVLRPEHQGRPNLHPSPWSWNDVVGSWSWIGREGAPVVVEVYAGAEEVELLINGRSVGRQPAGPAQGFRAAFETTYEPGVLEAVAYAGDEVVGRTELRSASEVVALSAAVERTTLVADTHDLAFVEIALVDDSGIVHATADRRVAVAVEGAGVLQALGSAAPASEEPFTGSGCTTFDGRALAIVRPTGPGAITVTVTAEGCEPVTVELEAEAS